MCRSHGQLKRGAKLSSLNTATTIGDILGMDFTSPIDGLYILVKVDYLSRRVHLDTCGSADAELVIKGLKRWIKARGSARITVTNYGKVFANREVNRCIQEIGIIHVKSLPQDHHSNGPTKRCHCTI